MKINEVEQTVGITKKNIRFYEQQGLLSPSRNLNNGYRDYSPEDIAILCQIKLLRKLGIPIDDIRKLQARHLTLEDCLRRHLITLERERKNLESVEKFCHRLLMEEAGLENLDIEQLLIDMENMEEGGTRFVDIKRKDKKLMKKYAVITAFVTIFIMLIPVGFIVGTAIVDTVPLPIVILFALFPFIGIAGTLLALKERIKEIEGGELDEAAKY